MRNPRGIRNLVVKIGSAVLAGEGGLDRATLGRLAGEMNGLIDAGVTLTLVSSGAVAAGVAELGLGRRPSDLGRLQATAAVGQRRLMDAWAAAWSPRPVAQLLVTRDDIDDRRRFLSLRDTLHAAHDLGAVPVLNENDTVSTDEIRPRGRSARGGTFGDNDMLAAAVAVALRADALVLLSTAPGLLDVGGRVVPAVTDLAAARRLVRAGMSGAGRGGMGGKLDAAAVVTAAGEPMGIASGHAPDALAALLAGEGGAGTWFEPAAAGRRGGRRRWLTAARCGGQIEVDAGAAAALRRGEASLLPIGVTGVSGQFDRGDVAEVVHAGRPIARGISRYAAADVARIAGRRTAELRDLDPPAAYDEVIHRDDLVPL